MWKPWIVEKLVSKGDYTYAIVREHPNATKNGYVLHHRIVMENKLKRLLDKSEIVHHKDECKKNNVSSNLVLHTNSSHARSHALLKGRLWVELVCPNCNKKFKKTKSQTHLDKPSKYKVTCCSTKCRGRFFALIQYHGLSKESKIAIKNNVVKIYKRFIS